MHTDQAIQEVNPTDVADGMPFLEGVGPERVDLYWPAISDQLEEACLDVARGSLDIWRRALAGKYCQLWVVWGGGAITGSVLTEVFEQRAGKTCAVVLIAGDGFADSLSHIETLSTWARAQGCVRMEIVVPPNSSEEAWFRQREFTPCRVHVATRLTND